MKKRDNNYLCCYYCCRNAIRILSEQQRHARIYPLNCSIVCDDFLLLHYQSNLIVCDLIYQTKKEPYDDPVVSETSHLVANAAVAVTEATYLHQTNLLVDVPV